MVYFGTGINNSLCKKKCIDKWCFIYISSMYSEKEAEISLDFIAD